MHYEDGILELTLDHITTTKFIDKFIFEGVKILDIDGERARERIRMPTNRKDYVLDILEILNETVKYRHLKQINMYNLILDVSTIIAIMQHEALYDLRFEGCVFSEHTLFYFFICLIRRGLHYNCKSNAECETKLIEKYVEHIPEFETNSLRILSFIENSTFLHRRLRNLTFIKCKIAEGSIMFGDVQFKTKMLRELLTSSIVEVLKSNGCLKTIVFPNQDIFIHNSKISLKDNYSIIATNIFDCNDFLMRNKRILQITKTTCLMLIAIKRFRQNESKEASQLALLDINIIVKISRWCFTFLKINIEHLKELASKI